MNINQKFITQRDRQGDDGVIPLINVVFLILIFFMVAGQIQKADPIKVTAPNSMNEARAKSKPNVMLLMGADRVIYFNDVQITPDDLESRLRQLFENTQDKTAFWVQIKADAAIGVEQLKPIFTAIRAAGLTKVSVATQMDKEAAL